MTCGGDDHPEKSSSPAGCGTCVNSPAHKPQAMPLLSRRPRASNGPPKALGRWSSVSRLCVTVTEPNVVCGHTPDNNHRLYMNTRYKRQFNMFWDKNCTCFRCLWWIVFATTRGSSTLSPNISAFFILILNTNNHDL